MERPAGRHERARRRLDTDVLRDQSGNSRYDDTGVRITEDERVHIPVNVCYGGCIEKLEQAKSKPGAKETLWLMND